MGVGLVVTACAGQSDRGPVIVTFPISALGAEGQVLVQQLARFMAENPGIKVVQRVTPDAADQSTSSTSNGSMQAQAIRTFSSWT